ncbi:MAG: hypothetical protein ABSD27_00350 [Bryobacteraceae bacterium]|jgi:type II secretory pathway pseudopilin PulG
MQRARKHDQSGFALLMVLAMAAIVAIMLYLQMPRVVFEAQRAKEDLLIQRGEQYTRAIRLYFRKFGRYPPSLEALENTNNLRFLRRRYRDPMTGSDEWRIIHFAGGGFPDSVTLRPPAQPAKAGAGEPESAAATATEEAGSEQAQAQVQPQPRWRLGASDHVQRGAAEAPPEPAVADQADRQGAEPASYPQPPPSSDAEGQVAGAPPPPPSNAEGQVAGAPPPPPSFQPAVEEQPEASQALAEPQPGVAPEGNAQPGAREDQRQPQSPQVPSVPGLPLPYGRPPGTLVGGVTMRTQPGGGISVQPDTANPASAPPLQSFAAGSGQTVTLGLQGSQSGSQQTVDPQTLIGRMLRGEQGGQPGLGRGNLSIGGGIAGVASKFEGAGIKVYGDRTKYNEWEFIYDVRKDPSTAPGRGGPLGPPTSLGGQPARSTGSTPR